jgi:hypothetical protein
MPHGMHSINVKWTPSDWSERLIGQSLPIPTVRAPGFKSRMVEFYRTRDPTQSAPTGRGTIPNLNARPRRPLRDGKRPKNSFPLGS